MANQGSVTSGDTGRPAVTDDERQPADGLSRPRRKLAAILHADVVGYSRSMGEDEAGTHARLMVQRQVVEATVTRHEGRIVGTAGDAVLAEFASVVEALGAAVEIQAELATSSAREPVEHRLPLRIGINVGDVIADGDDIFGDGVNVAARVQTLAEPGGIAVSGAVRDQAGNRSGLTFRDQGEHRVKNIEEPIRVYAVDATSNQGPGPRRRPSGRARIILPASVAVLLLAGSAAWLGLPERLYWSPSGSSSSTVTETSRPTIAVLPFENRSGSADQDHFSDGVTEDVIADLGRFSSLLVLSWNAVAPYRDGSITPQQLSRELNVRYVVGGTVRRDGDRLRVTVQLTDATRGVLLWSERYDEPIEDVFAVQNRITRQVVAALAVHVTQLEEARAFAKPTEALGAYELVLRGRAKQHQVERSANLEARALFEQALALDARYADALVGIGWTYMNEFLLGWSEWPDRTLAEVDRLTRRAIELDERNASAHALLAEVLRFRGDRAAAEREIERALQLNPNNATSHALHGANRVMAGRFEEAINSIELAIRLNPHPPTYWLVDLGLAYYSLGRYQDAIDLLDRYDPPISEDSGPLVVRAMAHAQLGNGEAAGRAVAALRRVSPFFDARVFARSFHDPEHRRHLVEGLHKAGLE